MPARLFAPLLGLLLVLALPSAARADLALTGGTPAQQRQLLSVYAALPPCCRSSPACRVCVSLMANSAMNAYLQSCAAAASVRLLDAGVVNGIYEPPTATIALRDSSPAADLSGTFAHEYGHYVWFTLLTPAQRARYGKIYQAQCAAHHLVSLYAAVSLPEGFAEAFRCYVMDRAALQSADPASCAYLNALLCCPATHCDRSTTAAASSPAAPAVTRLRPAALER